VEERRKSALEKEESIEDTERAKRERTLGKFQAAGEY
jgi:hypothetical protein